MSTILPGSPTQSHTPDPPWIVRMEHITKRFPGVTANQDVHLRVRAGTFHAVIGENGAGKSTLLNILYGRYPADSGQIFINKEEVTHSLNSPADAIRRGLGLVSQHYALIPALTVIENVILGAEPALPGGVLQPGQAAGWLSTLTEQLGLVGIDLNARAERLSVAAQQKVEILKALYRGARILLLDEPTATLAPQESDSLFALLRTLAVQGTTIVFVTHKLREVMAHSSAITVLRRGRNAGDFQTAQTSEEELLQHMIGTRSGIQVFRYSGIQEDASTHVQQAAESKTFPASVQQAPPCAAAAQATSESGTSKPEDLNTPTPEYPHLLRIEHLTVRNARKAIAVQGIDLEVSAGEILGIAGVDGSGQRELSEAIVGLSHAETGRILLNEREISRMSVRRRRDLGIGYIPEDRLRAGMVLDFTIAENYLLGHEWQRAWGGGFLLRLKGIHAEAGAMLRRYDVRTGTQGVSLMGRTLSGGNQQKVVIARAIDSRPSLLVACQPTRGLDIGATQFVYTILHEARDQGVGVVLFSLDLDEILELSDRIAVMFNGRIAGVLPRSEANAQTIGALMTGVAE